MKGKILKFSFLIATLAIPIVIFLFLKSYGTNEFDIPIYYPNGVESAFADCTYPMDTFRLRMSNKNNKKANVTLFFSENDEFTSSDLVNVKDRLNAQFKQDFSFTAHGQSITSDSINSTDPLSFRQLMHCNFVTDTVNQFILHDAQGRIRGYYNTALEDIDRLIVEMKILLENE